ncbi:molybdate ABC transporter substrate-binding protein [Kurthia sibirica]|uniref:Molybdate ABC transporter substrate-binding protein n=2 Tax=Kurthia sibirica TaxID=202750 RepID=A0A2U3AKV9_9BACL|nr:molybdate ABC transporter substrate-binding protein [Kurthia sibirica]
MSFLFMMILTGCTSNDASKESSKKHTTELTISAAASLQDSLVDLQTIYKKEHADVTLQFNFGGSGALQQQISQGAPVDLFFSAAQNQFDALIKDELIEKKHGIDLLSNELVLVVPKDNEKKIHAFKDVTKASKIALGTPEVVPAGQYGLETLKKLKLWTTLEAKTVYAKDVRQVLTYVETGNVDAGIVYKTDALTTNKATIIATAKSEWHTPIIYPVGIIKDSKHMEEAQAFYAFLQSEKAMKVFEKYGFKGAN